MKKWGWIALVAVCSLAAVSTVYGINVMFWSKSPIAKMNEDDLAMLRRAAEDALTKAEDGETVGWSNPETGSRGNITPTETQIAQGTVCRKVRIENHAGNLSGKSVMRFCEQANGAWKAVP